MSTAPAGTQVESRNRAITFAGRAGVPPVRRGRGILRDPAGCGTVVVRCGETGRGLTRRSVMGDAVMTTRRQADGAIVVDVRGTLDAATVDALRESLMNTLHRERPGTVVVDLTFVTFMDSMGIGALVTGYHAAREVGTRFLLRTPSEFVHRQLRLTGLTGMFGLPASPSTTQSYTS